MAQNRSATRTQTRQARAQKHGPRATSPLGLLARFVALLGLAWGAGFVLFVLALPGPASAGTQTDAVAVLTGGPGRLARGVDVLKAGLARRMLVSGVHPSVKPAELAKAAGIPEYLFDCCVDLGFKADSTRSNAEEVSAWVEARGFTSVRLVTASYHMPRASTELRARLSDKVIIVEDSVQAGLPLFAMLVEYAKFQASWLMLRVRPA